MSKKYRITPSRLLQGLKDKLNLEKLCPGISLLTMPQTTKGETPRLPIIDPRRNKKANKQAGLLSSKTISATCRQSFNDLVNPDEPRILFFIDYDSGKRIKYRLDFNSPRTKKAAGQLGLTYEDCLTRYYNFC